MNKLWLILIFLFSNSFAEDDKIIKEVKKENKVSNQIPVVISEDLTLKPTKEPYTTNGFKVPRGVTLTIEPGVNIVQEGSKLDSEPIIIEGSLIIGKKGGATVTFEIPSTATFSGANIEMFHAVLTSSTIILSGGTEGTFNNCTFVHILTKKIKVPFEMNIPKRGILSFTHCNFINHSVGLPENIIDAKEKIQFTYCAFTPRWDGKIERYSTANIDSNIFLVGNKCDLYSYIEWKKMPYDFDPPIKTEWFIKDQTMKNSLVSTLTTAKGFKVNFTTPFTSFKPEQSKPKEKK